MSTKTTFKRIALVAVAALGLGVLSVAPSSATVSNVAVALVQNGTSTNSGEAYVSDSTTAAVISVSALLDNVGDTVTVTFVEKSKPAGADATPYSYFLDTTTGRASSTIVDTATLTTAASASMPKFLNAGTGTAGAAQAIGSTFRVATASVGYVGAKFAVQLDSASARTISGDYVYTAVVKVYNQGTLSSTTYTQDVTISVPKTAAVATTPSTLKSYAVLTTTSADPGNVVDSSITGVSTASGTAIGYVYVALRNANNSSAAVDSITATITGAGVLSVGGVTGSSFKIAATGDQVISVLPDGRAGVATINIATSGTTYAPKSVTFYAKAAKTITATVAHPVLKVGANTGAVAVTAVDANGTNWTGAAYIVASSAADALVAGSATTPVACAAWNATDGILCPVTAIAAGTAKLKVIDASTVAAATATSNEITVTSSVATANTVKIAFDKATYAPFEKAKITVTPLDIKGAPIAAGTWSNLFATGGITSTVGFSANSDTTTPVAITTDATTGSVTYTVYMPAGSGDVTISATGGTSLPAAGQVKVSATATVVNSSVDAATDAANEATDAANAATDAALAAADAADAATAAAQDASDAVAALSATVAKLVASLKAQITSLTNLVIKIQKKVRA
jgi:trimeric autotransporter adhesin